MVEPFPSEGAADEAALVAAAREGDRASFEALYRRYAPMVHAIALGQLDRSEAGDLVQDVFERALKGLRWLRDSGAFGGWLANIARNRARELVRSRRPHQPQGESVTGSTPAVEAEAAEALAAIRALPEAYRETLLMRLCEGMSGPEIAARTGLAEGSVRVNLHRGMALLRERLEGRSR